MIFCYVGNSTKFKTPISLRIKGFDKLTDTDIILILFKEKDGREFYANVSKDVTDQNFTLVGQMFYRYT